MATFAGIAGIIHEEGTSSEEMERMAAFAKARAYVKYERDQSCEAAQEAYLELFHDLRDHGDYWFHDDNDDGFFSHICNGQHMDDICKALNALASCQRKAGNLAEALATVQMFKRVVDAIRAVVAESNESLIRRADYLQYIHDIVAMNVRMQLDEREEFIPLFRRAVEYELRMGMTLHEQEKTTVVYALGPKEYFPLTMEKFRDVTDDMCWEAIQLVMAFERGETTSPYKNGEDIDKVWSFLKEDETGDEAGVEVNE